MCKRKAQQLHYSKLFCDCKADLKATWKPIRGVTCSRKLQCDKLPEFFRHQGNIVTSSQDIANNFNQYFSQVGPKLAAKIPRSNKNFTHFLGAPNEEEFKLTEMSESRILNFF